MILLFLGFSFLFIGIFSLVKKRTLNNPFAYAFIIGAILCLMIFFSPAWQDFIDTAKYRNDYRN